MSNFIITYASNWQRNAPKPLSKSSAKRLTKAFAKLGMGVHIGPEATGVAVEADSGGGYRQVWSQHGLPSSYAFGGGRDCVQLSLSEFFDAMNA